MTKREAYKEFYSALNEANLLEYGSTIPTQIVHELLNIEIPSSAPKRVYDQLALMELAAIDYVRNTLLGHGKYISGTSTGYRILLPSENSSQIDLYMESADRKLSRALKLSRNTPKDVNRTADQTEARIMMKRHGLRHTLDSKPQDSP